MKQRLQKWKSRASDRSSSNWKATLAFASLFFITTIIAAQDDPHIYPTHWWVGMVNPKLQLIIHQDRIATQKISLQSYPGVRLLKQSTAENPNYVFLDLSIDKTARPGKLKFSGRPAVPSGIEAQTFEFELKARNKEDGKTRIQGVSSADFIYLIMPDRFANGDPSNDYFIDMADTMHDRNNPFDRHGGDLKGISDHLDYIKELGVTALWLTPVVENDMPRTQEGGSSRSTYHGYAFTDQYAVDRRLGGNEDYLQLSQAMHTRGLKLIQDAVYNHIGDNHWSVKDPPMKDWLNQWPVYTNTSYREQPLIDPHASENDRRVTTDGWFTRFLVDLNQRNPYVSKFLIQYAIWATEEYGVDGWRVDTYFYNDPAFLNAINTALFKEFPKLTVFGETSVQSVVSGAYFSRNRINTPFKHNLPGITDFPVFYAMVDALNQQQGGTTGVNRLYNTLAEDLLYEDPSRNCIFLDNHDQDRIYSVIGEDFDKYKMGINWLMTLRGIPQLYYGTEILMKNKRDPSDAEVRRDFPGGWEKDSVNKFNKEARTVQEQAAWDYLSTLARFRKNSSALKTGKLMQYVPEHGAYVYFRYDEKQTIAVISNTGDKPFKPEWNRFDERLVGFKKIKNVITGEEASWDDLLIQPKQSLVLELLK